MIRTNSHARPGWHRLPVRARLPLCRVEGLKMDVTEFLDSEQLKRGYFRTLLIVGETGTGKERVARALHMALDGQLQRGWLAITEPQIPFVDFNCSACPETLIDAELFGYVKGAFTDARSSKPGLLDAAKGGVLFLDEIGAMRQDLQAKLLRAIDQGEFRPLGAGTSKPLDCVVIAATNEPKKLRPELHARFRAVIRTYPLRRYTREGLALWARGTLLEAVMNLTGTDVITLAEADFMGRAFRACENDPAFFEGIRGLLRSTACNPETAEAVRKRRLERLAVKTRDRVFGKGKAGLREDIAVTLLIASALDTWLKSAIDSRHSERGDGSNKMSEEALASAMKESRRFERLWTSMQNYVLTWADPDIPSFQISLGDDALDALSSHPWPQNFRGLYRVLEMVLLNNPNLYETMGKAKGGSVITAAHVQAVLDDLGRDSDSENDWCLPRDISEASALRTFRHECERQFASRVVNRYGSSLKAQDYIGLGRNTLDKWKNRVPVHNASQVRRPESRRA